jgi:HPt (histidine-containing phosphotransfer) domain-containing protein
MSPIDLAAGRHEPVFDLPTLHKLAALDPSGQNQLLGRVLRAFEQSLQRLGAEIEQARRAGDGQAARLAAHTLKSSSASVGALRLSRLCLALERALRPPADRDAGEGEAPWHPLAEELLAELGQVQQALPGVAEQLKLAAAILAARPAGAIRAA